MLTICWAVKGGSGTTVVAASLALGAPGGAVLVDLDGELPAALGMIEPNGTGVHDWIRSTASPAALGDLLVEATPGVALLPRGGQLCADDSSRWAELAGWLSSRGTAVVDAGTREPPPGLVAAADRSLLVTRACYLSLRRGVAVATRPTGIVLVAEPGRALGERDVEAALGAPVVATVSLDPAIARAVDAGLLACRLPRTIQRELRSAA